MLKMNLHRIRKYIFRQLLRRFFVTLLPVLILAVVVSCSQKTAYDPVKRARAFETSGEFSKLNSLADSVLASADLNSTQKRQIDSLREISRRIQLDFTMTEPEVKSGLEKYFQELDSVQMNSWEKSRKLEVMRINGEKRYFKNAVRNLFRLDDPANVFREKVEGRSVNTLDSFCIQHTGKVISATKTSGVTVLPVSMKLTYSIRVKPNIVPEGEIIRCWMPFPREGNARQKNIHLLKSDPEEAVIAPESALQRSVYLEKKAVKDQSTTFQIAFEVETSAQYFDLKASDIKPYDTTAEVYRENTKERPPQIVFSAEIRKLGDQIVEGETNPFKIVQKIYQWINDSVRWASALEYSTIQNIPEYVLKNRHGDCGMQTLLFMTLARCQGIPAKWQSGWMLHPNEVNLHDWCEVYYEGVGWVPVDQSFGLQFSADPKVHHFYTSGIDSYRLIVNDDYARELMPEKKFMRSEPYDFQRGELEWEGGNLYFDQWSWHMQVEYN
jgi:hypothetical protein